MPKRQSVCINDYGQKYVANSQCCASCPRSKSLSSANIWANGVTQRYNIESIVPFQGSEPLGQSVEQIM